jgi:hypothetical protein
MNELLDILAHGDDAQLAARVYDTEALSESARQVSVGLLQLLRAPQGNAALEVVERHPSGRFELVILRVPWKHRAGDPVSSLHPLLVAEQSGQLRAVGFMLPWNDIMPRLEAEMDIIMPLSMLWIGRVMALRKAN